MNGNSDPYLNLVHYEMEAAQRIFFGTFEMEIQRLN